MSWTTDPPKKLGWYFFRYSPRTNVLACLVTTLPGTEDRIATFPRPWISDGKDWDYLFAFQGEWAGPIAVPESKQEPAECDCVPPAACGICFPGKS